MRSTCHSHWNQVATPILGFGSDTVEKWLCTIPHTIAQRAQLSEQVRVIFISASACTHIDSCDAVPRNLLWRSGLLFCGVTIPDKDSKFDLVRRACAAHIDGFSMPCNVFDAQHAKQVGRHKLLLKIIWFPKKCIFPCHTSTATSIGREDCVISKLSAAPIPHDS